MTDFKPVSSTLYPCATTIIPNANMFKKPVGNFMKILSSQIYCLCLLSVLDLLLSFPLRENLNNFEQKSELKFEPLSH